MSTVSGCYTEKNVFTSEEMDDPCYRMRDIVRETGGVTTRRKRILVTMLSQSKPESSNSDEKHYDFCGGQRDCYMDADAKCLYDLFKSKYNLREKDIAIYFNRKVEQVHEILQTIGNTKSNEDYDVFIFAFLTYLTTRDVSRIDQTVSEELLDFNDGQASLSSLIDDVKDKEALRMRPKLFLVQADDLRLKRPTYSTKGKPYEIKTVKIPTDADRLVIMSTVPQLFGVSFERRSSTNLLSRQVQATHIDRTDAGALLRQPSDAPRESTELGNDQHEHRCSLMIQAFKEVLEDKRYEEDDLFSKTPMINARYKELISDLLLTGDYAGVDLPLPLVTSTLTKYLML